MFRISCETLTDGIVLLPYKFLGNKPEVEKLAKCLAKTTGLKHWVIESAFKGSEIQG